MKVRPLGQFILAKAQEAGLSRRDIVPRLGYPNLNKSYRRFDQVIHGNIYNHELLERIAQVLGVDYAEIDAARQATLCEIREEQHQQEADYEARCRAEFRPHLWVIHERSVPSPIFVVAFCGVDRFLRADLPEGIVNLSRPEQLRVIKEVAQSHYKEKEGSAIPFGKILGYLYRYTYDASLKLTIEGEVVGEVQGAPSVGRVSITIGNKTLQGGGAGIFSKLGIRPGQHP